MKVESQKDFVKGSPKTLRFERLEVWQQARLFIGLPQAL